MAYLRRITDQNPQIIASPDYPPHKICGPNCKHIHEDSALDFYPKAFPIHCIRKWFRCINDLTFAQRSWSPEQLKQFQAMPETKMSFHSNVLETRKDKEKKDKKERTKAGPQKTMAMSSAVPKPTSDQKDKDMKKVRDLYLEMAKLAEPHLNHDEKNYISKMTNLVESENKRESMSDKKKSESKSQPKPESISAQHLLDPEPAWLDLNQLVSASTMPERTIHVNLPLALWSMIIEYSNMRSRCQQIQLLAACGYQRSPSSLGPHFMLSLMQRVDLTQIVHKNFLWIPSYLDWMDQYLSIPERLVMIYNIQQFFIDHAVSSKSEMIHLAQKEMNDMQDYMLVAARFGYMAAIEWAVQFTQDTIVQQNYSKSNLDDFIRFWRTHYKSFHAENYHQSKHSLTVYDRSESWYLARKKTDAMLGNMYWRDDMKHVLPIQSPTHVPGPRNTGPHNPYLQIHDVYDANDNANDSKVDHKDSDTDHDDDSEPSFWSGIKDEFFNFVHGLNAQDQCKLSSIANQGKSNSIANQGKSSAIVLFEGWCAQAQKDDDILLWLIREILDDPPLFQYPIQNSTLYLDYPYKSIPSCELTAVWFCLQLWVQVWEETDDAWQRFPLEYILLLLAVYLGNGVSESADSESVRNCFMQLSLQLIELNRDPNSLAMEVTVNHLYRNLPICKQAIVQEKRHAHSDNAEQVFFGLQDKSTVAKARIALLRDLYNLSLPPNERKHDHINHHLLQCRHDSEGQYLLSNKSDNYHLWFLCYRLINYPSQPYKWTSHRAAKHPNDGLPVVLPQNASGSMHNAAEFNEFIRWLIVCKLYEYYGEKPWFKYWQYVYDHCSVGKGKTKLISALPPDVLSQQGLMVMPGGVVRPFVPEYTGSYLIPPPSRPIRYYNHYNPDSLPPPSRPIRSRSPDSRRSPEVGDDESDEYQLPKQRRTDRKNEDLDVSDGEEKTTTRKKWALHPRKAFDVELAESDVSEDEETEKRTKKKPVQPRTKSHSSISVKKSNDSSASALTTTKPTKAAKTTVAATPTKAAKTTVAATPTKPSVKASATALATKPATKTKTKKRIP